MKEVKAEDLEIFLQEIIGRHSMIAFYDDSLEKRDGFGGFLQHFKIDGDNVFLDYTYRTLYSLFERTTYF